jgi:hypothetical protein
MRCTSRVQRIRRATSTQWYVHVPVEVARRLRFTKGEVVEWQWDEQGQVRLLRQSAPPATQKGASR